MVNRILVVEDEPAVSGFVTRSLELEGFESIVAGTAREALEKVAQSPPQAIVLDLMLPDMDGLMLLEKIRETNNAPIIVLTARSDWADRVRGLNRGADDYLAKPFRMEELLARIRALLRRSKTESQTIQIGSLHIDLASRSVTYEDRRLFLSATEYEILLILAENRGKPVSRVQLLDAVWDDRMRDSNVVEVYMTYLRKKLESNGRPRIIVTIRGLGYMLRTAGSL